MMPPKIRDLISELKRLGFEFQGSKGSHRKFKHPRYPNPIILAGKAGNDAKPYQINAVRDARKELRD
jgi:predicted RNA binding protein YcfA (HicA-like mRNA interferase family)